MADKQQRISTTGQIPVAPKPEDRPAPDVQAAQAAAQVLRQHTRPESPLPEPQLPELRRLVRKVCALEARERGEDVACLNDGALPPRLIGVDLERLTVGEELASISGGCRLVTECCRGAGEDVILVDRNGAQVAL